MALWLDCFDFGQWNLDNDFVDATIYYFCRDVVRILVNIWDGVLVLGVCVGPGYSYVAILYGCHVFKFTFYQSVAFM